MQQGSEEEDLELFQGQMIFLSISVGDFLLL
jgi:hypothetical protein